jgi:protein disulfide-isomerase
MSLLRRFVLAVLVTCSFAARVEAQSALTWDTDLARAQQAAAQSNRLVLAHFWGTWCQPCMRMEHEVLSKPNVGTALAPHYVAVKIQVEQGMNEALARQYGVDAYPCDIVMTPKGEIVHRSKGFQPAEQYVAMLQQAAQHAALAQARAAAPAQQLPAPAATPAATPAAAPVAAPSSSNSTASMTDDRYSYYFQDRNAGPTPAAAAPVVPAMTTPVASPSVATPTPVSTPAVAATAPARPSYSPPSDNRYADYKPATTPTPAVAAPSIATPSVATPNTAAPTIAATPAVAPVAPPAGVASTSKPAPPAVQLPPGCPPLALDGYCPVTVTNKMVWKRGDVRYGAVHRGRTYLFATPEDQKTFLADPDRYSPVISGNDPVVALEKGDTVAGKREFGLMCQNRMFLFSSKESYDKFCSDSKRYSGQIFQALQADDLKRR